MLRVAFPLSKVPVALKPSVWIVKSFLPTSAASYGIIVAFKVGFLPNACKNFSSAVLATARSFNTALA